MFKNMWAIAAVGRLGTIMENFQQFLPLIPIVFVTLCREKLPTDSSLGIFTSNQEYS